MTTWCSTSTTCWKRASPPARQAGIPRARLVVDPGIGFGKTLAHNLALLGRLGIFHGLGCALLLGASRKSFIARLTGAGHGERLPGSLAAALLGAAQGVQILRVHDVAATRQALAVWESAAGRRISGPERGRTRRSRRHRAHRKALAVMAFRNRQAEAP